jgi:hypothetical protein
MSVDRGIISANGAQQLDLQTGEQEIRGLEVEKFDEYLSETEEEETCSPSVNFESSSEGRERGTRGAASKPLAKVLKESRCRSTEYSETRH